MTEVLALAVILSDTFLTGSIILTSANPTPPFLGARLVAEAGTTPSEPTTSISIAFVEEPFDASSSVDPSLSLRESLKSFDASTSPSFESSADDLSLLARSTTSSVGNGVNNGLIVLAGWGGGEGGGVKQLEWSREERL